MKYLKIHKLLWFVICLTYLLLFEMSAYLIYNIFHFIWCFRFFRWEYIFSNTCKYRGSIYTDHTPLETFMRHYNMFKDLNK